MLLKRSWEDTAHLSRRPAHAHVSYVGHARRAPIVPSVSVQASMAATIKLHWPLLLRIDHTQLILGGYLPTRYLSR